LKRQTDDDPKGLGTFYECDGLSLLEEACSVSMRDCACTDDAMGDADQDDYEDLDPVNYVIIGEAVSYQATNCEEPCNHEDRQYLLGPLDTL